jgi:DNA-3-methyladenine glycosylase II
MSQNLFFLQPVSPFRLDLTVWALRRRPENAMDRWDGQTYCRVLPLPAAPVEVAVTQIKPPETPELRVLVQGQPLRSPVKAAVTSALERLLGLRIDMAEFYRFSMRHGGQLGQLATRFQGMKPPRFTTVFESVINAIASQQVTRTVGILFLNRLAANYGVALREKDAANHAFPRPEDFAGLCPTDLRQLGFSRQKGRAMIELAKSITEEGLDLEELAALTDEEAVERLCGLRGVGRWTAEYALLRGLGRTHVFPGDDVGARNNLQRWLHLADPLDYASVRRILNRWYPYGGLIYFHLLLDRLAEAGFLQAEPSQPPTGKLRPGHVTVRPLTIWTVGHSTRTVQEFIDLLRQHRIDILVDVRHFPGSRHVPQFNKTALPDALATAGIRYEHLTELGGRRPVRPDSRNLAWRNASFRGYADYMETPAFRDGVNRLLEIARAGRTAVMCAEAVWWRCHRSMIADYLKAIGVRVVHILSPNKVQEHPYTPAARLADGQLTYEGTSQQAHLPLQEVMPMIHTFKAGDHVEWNSEAGRVRGTIKKKITGPITFKGYTVHASKEEPQYLIKSDKTDHLAMHKGSALKKISKGKQSSKEIK